MQSVLCSLSLSIVVKKTYGRMRDILRGVHAISFSKSRPSWSAHRGAPTLRGVPISRGAHLSFLKREKIYCMNREPRFPDRITGIDVRAMYQILPLPQVSHRTGVD